MSEFRLTVLAEKSIYDENKCSTECPFMVKNFWLNPKRCNAFNAPLPVAAGEAYRLSACKQNEVQRP